jgi:ATP-binding cassette subfamily B protein
LVPFLQGTIIEDISSAKYKTAITFAAILFGIEFLHHVVNVINTYFYKNLQNNLRMDIKHDVVKTALNLKMKNYDELGNGLFLTRVTSDLNVVCDTFINLTEKLLEFLSKIGFIVYVFILSPNVGFLLVFFILLRYVIYEQRLKWFLKLKKPVMDDMEKVNSTVGEIVRGVKDVKTLNCEEQLLNRIDQEQAQFTRDDNKEWYVGITLNNLSSFMNSVLNFCFILYGAYLLKEQSLTSAVFYTVYMYKGNVMAMAVAFGQLKKYLKEAEVSCFRIFELMNPKVFETETFGDQYIDNYSGRIEFKDVHFDYDGKNKVLNGLNLTIEPDEITAFVGGSGCGKTTIISLISKLYDIKSGEILFDGVNQDELSKEFIRSKIAIVTQTPYIFNMSIRDNLLMVKKDATDEDIREVCRKADLLHYIDSLQDGLDTVVGEGGARVSGGQRQRLAIARALLADAKIIIFDESTSALDNIAQDEVMKTITNLKKDRTIIIIAHRLTTIQNCDKIYVLKRGVVVGSGVHKDLIKDCEDYKKLYLTEQV